MRAVYDLVHPAGALTDGWPGTLALTANPPGSYNVDYPKRVGGELRWEPIPVLGQVPRMHPWWTVELTAEKAKAHVQRWSREGGTHYIMWWSLSVNKEPWLYDVAIFWVPQENDVQAPNPVNPPWADLS